MSKKHDNLWHALDTEGVLAVLRTDAVKGLSGKEAALRRMRRGQNAIWCVHHTSLGEMIRGEFFDLSSILLIIAALMTAFFKGGREAAILISILALSAAIRTAICVVVHSIFEDAARANIPKASVIRGGKLRMLSADAVVPGDILLLDVGMSVVADVRLLSGDITVTELGVTDNRDLQKKSAASVYPSETVCEARGNILFAGSTVVGGCGRGVVVESGEDTYIFARRGYIHIPAGENIPILTRVAGWCRNVSLVMLAAVLFLSLGGSFFGKNDLTIDTLFLSALALAVASMSEFLCVISSVLFAVSVQRLRTESHGGTILWTADAIERFAEAQCLIVSDPRLLHSGKIQLQNIFANGMDVSTKEDPTAVLQLLGLSLLCRCGSVQPLSTGDGGALLDETTQMLRALYDAYDDARAVIPLPTVMEFAECNRLYTALTTSSQGTIAYVCGSLADVLACCNEFVKDGQTVELTPRMRELLLARTQLPANASMKTIGIARRLSPYANLSRPSVLQSKMSLVGFFSVVDPIEAELARLVNMCKLACIRIVVLADKSGGFCRSAEEAGIVAPHTPIISDAEQLDAYLSAEDSTMENFCVFAGDRLSRESIVRRIAEHIPQTVYLGDRLQDIPLFEQASASIAADRHFVGSPQCMFSAADAGVQLEREQKGSGVADAIRLISVCKGAFMRLNGIMKYLLATQILRLTVMIAATFFGVPMITPVQLLWWGIFLDLLAVLTCAFAHRDDRALVLNTEAIRLPALKNGLLLPVISGVLSGLLLSLSATFASRQLTVSDASAVIYIGGLITSLLFLATLYPVGKILTFRLNSVGILYGIFVLATIIATIWGMDLWLLLFAFVPALVTPILLCVYRHITRDHHGYH